MRVEYSQEGLDTELKIIPENDFERSFLATFDRKCIETRTHSGCAQYEKDGKIIEHWTLWGRVFNEDGTIYGPHKN